MFGGSAMNVNKTLIALLFFISLTDCTYNVKVINFESSQTLHGGFNTFNRAVWVTMEDGTKLSKKYVEIRDDKLTFGNTFGSVFTGTTFGSFSTFGSSYSLSSTSIGYAILSNPNTKLMMEVLVKANFDNTGYGEARTNDGRLYKVIF
jgi:hypothetical protein